MSNTTNNAYDLEERCFVFAKSVAVFCKKVPYTPEVVEYKKQVVRSSGSVGANYIEANEALSKKDFLHRIRIARKEAKETAYWLRLIVETGSTTLKQEGVKLMDEAIQLKKILSSIVEKSK